MVASKSLLAVAMAKSPIEVSEPTEVADPQNDLSWQIP